MTHSRSIDSISPASSYFHSFHNHNGAHSIEVGHPTDPSQRWARLAVREDQVPSPAAGVDDEVGRVGKWDLLGACFMINMVIYMVIYIYIIYIYIYMGFASKILVFRCFYNHQINPKNPKNSIPPFKLHRYSIGLSSLPLKTIQPQVVKCYPLVNHGSLNVPMGHITQPWMVYGKNNGYYFRWCPIYPKWDIYQPL